MTRRASLVVVASVLGTALLPLRVRATATERWLVVPVLAGDNAKGLDPAALAAPVEAELRGARRTVIPNGAASKALEARHSTEPTQLGAQERKRLSLLIRTAAQHLALGELAEAQRAMEVVQTLPGPTRDALHRERGLARKIFDNCLMAAYLLERAKQHAPAVQQMRKCTQDYPAFRPEGRAYPPEVRSLFEEASRFRKERGPSALHVVTRDRSACSVRLQGVEMGKSPLHLTDLEHGPARVQLECEPGGAGRVHALELVPGDQELAIDPRFEAALRTGTGISLAYATEQEREARAASDAEALGRILSVDRVVLLWNRPGAFGTDIAVRPAVPDARELSRVSYAAESGYEPGGASKLAGAFVAWAARQGPAAANHPPAGPIRDDTLRIEQPAPLPSPRPPSPARPSRPPPSTALPVTASLSAPGYTQQHVTAGVILAVLGGASSAVSWALYAARQSERTVVNEPVDTTSYKKLGVLTLSTAAVGTSLLSVSEYFWLPDHPSVPALAWVAGAFGLSIGAAAITLSWAEGDCRIGDDRVSCQRFWADQHFGPVLFLHALPLMTAPVWYGLRIAFRPANVQLTFAPATRGLPVLQLRGVF